MPKTLNKPFTSVMRSTLRVPTKSADNQTTQEVEAALDLVSAGIQRLQQVGMASQEPQEGLTAAFKGAKLVDIGARLNASYGALERLLAPIKSTIKVAALEEAVGRNDPKLIYRGVVYQANVTRITKTVMPAEKVRKFLGKQVFKVQEQREEVQVSFEVKE